MSERREQLRKQILEADDIKRELITIPEWDITVEVRGMTTLQRAKLFEESRSRDGERVDTRVLFPLLVVQSCYVPGTDERVFDDSDIDVLNAKSAGATGRIAELALSLSGLSKEEVEAIKKD